MTNKRAAAISQNDADITTDILKDTLPSGLSGSTIKSYTITLRAFVNWLRNEGILRSDPMSKLKKQTQVAKTRQQEFYTEIGCG